jgi:hypothetical protein
MEDQTPEMPERKAAIDAHELPPNQTESTSLASSEEDQTPEIPKRKAAIDAHELSSNQTEATSLASSEVSALFDNPDYIPPDQQDILLLDVTSKNLHTKISGELGVKYLSSAEGPQTSPVFGRLYGINKRLMVNIVTHRRTRRGEEGPENPSFNLFFLCDTSSPSTFICEDAVCVLLGDDQRANDVIPKTLFVQLADFPAVEAHVSPKPSHYVDVNVIGMDLLSQLKTTIFGKDLEFELAHMEHTVH